MNNRQFLQTVKESFLVFLKTHSRSNKKLIVLHGAIAKDIKKRLGRGFKIKSLGVGSGKEGKLKGRYMEKKIDIFISKNDFDFAGIGIKFVMNYYSQNSNNYFENMLGETANIRTNNKAYFQIFILPEEMPYFDKKGKITRWEKITDHNIDKYVVLSHDNTDRYFHTPVKTLLFIVKFPVHDHRVVRSRSEYKRYFLRQSHQVPLCASASISGSFGNAVVVNDYEAFMEKITHFLQSI